MDPQVPQYSLQFWDVEWLLLLYLVIYEIPDVLYWVEVQKIATPVNGVNVFLFKPLLNDFCLMSWSTIRMKWSQSWTGQKGSRWCSSTPMEVSFCIATFFGR